MDQPPLEGGVHGGLDDWHFDDCEFDGAVEFINDRYDGSAERTRANRSAFGATDQFGNLLHTVMDFYAHSNWVEMGFPQTDDPDTPEVETAQSDLVDISGAQGSLGLDWYTPPNAGLVRAQVVIDGVVRDVLLGDDDLEIPNDWDIREEGIGDDVPTLFDADGNPVGVLLMTGEGWQDDECDVDWENGFQVFNGYEHDETLNKDSEGRPGFEEARALADQADVIRVVPDDVEGRVREQRRPAGDAVGQAQRQAAPRRLAVRRRGARPHRGHGQLRAGARPRRRRPCRRRARRGQRRHRALRQPVRVQSIGAQAEPRQPQRSCPMARRHRSAGCRNRRRCVWRRASRSTSRCTAGTTTTKRPTAASTPTTSTTRVATKTRCSTGSSRGSRRARSTDRFAVAASDDLEIDYRLSTGTDSDTDGLGDCDERVDGTDPLEADSDGDGLDDGDEVNVTAPTHSTTTPTATELTDGGDIEFVQQGVMNLADSRRCGRRHGARAGRSRPCFDDVESELLAADTAEAVRKLGEASASAGMDGCRARWRTPTTGSLRCADQRDLRALIDLLTDNLERA